MRRPLRLAIIIPTYNEAANIEALLTSIQSVVSHQPSLSTTAYIIDDSSPDGTSELVSRIARTLTSRTFAVHLTTRPAKSGLGSAYIDGFQEVLRAKKPFDYVLQMDADLSHDPTYINSLVYQARQTTEMVIASRYMPGGGTPDWSWYRKLLSRGGNLYSRLFLGSRVTDYTGGYNMYSTKLLRRVNIGSITADGYGFQIELKYRALSRADSVIQIPIVFVDRQHGHSKIPRSTLLRNLILVPKIRFLDKKRI